MNLIDTGFPGMVLVEPRVFGDQRGFFYESFNADRFAAAGLPTVFRQDNHSRSMRGVLRGLHYQLTRPKAKLVGVLHGEVFDVALDIRRGSPTFGKAYTTILSGETQRYLFIPEGFAHGFCVLSDRADFVYKCTDVYVAEDEHGILWNDPGLEIDWPIDDPIVSDKDRKNAPLTLDRTNLPEFRG